MLFVVFCLPVNLCSCMYEVLWCCLYFLTFVHVLFGEFVVLGSLVYPFMWCLVSLCCCVYLYIHVHVLFGFVSTIISCSCLVFYFGVVSTLLSCVVLCLPVYPLGGLLPCG